MVRTASQLAGGGGDRVSRRRELPAVPCYTGRDRKPRIGDRVRIVGLSSTMCGQAGTVTGFYEAGRFATLALDCGRSWDVWASELAIERGE